MWSFLGLACYYRKFVDEFSKIAAPIMTFTCKNVKFEWTSACEQSFQGLKGRFETIQILTILEGEDGFCHLLRYIRSRVRSSTHAERQSDC